MKRTGVFKRIMVIVSCMIIMIIGVACAKESTIIGKWLYDNGSQYEYIFNEEGTGTYKISDLSPVEFQYSIDGDKLTITKQRLGQEIVEEYTYSLDKNKLVITSDTETVTYDRQK